MKALLLAAVLELAPVWAMAQDFDAGVAAYERGDYAAALREFRPLAEAGDAWAQFALGVIYDNGEGVAQNDAEAVRWYRKAAEQGVAVAQVNLGVMYDTGQGAPQDDAEAVRWYRMAAEQDVAEAQFNLGAMYALGQGVVQDDATAHMWLNIAAANGDQNAGEVRDTLADRMNRAEIAEAQRRARVCVESGYRDCE